MKLLTHRLMNFKGIKDFTLDTQGQNVNIYGENATGKTTLYDAFLWLLFNKDSQNKTDFAIKTLDENGNEIHGLEHAVETVLDLGGKPLTLRKVYQEKWTKKRGAAKKEFTGHTTDHFIDGVPVKKGEYEERISAIAKEDIFRLLTNPTYYNDHLRWQDRRKILLDVCGDISDGDVIASDKNLSKLPEILGARSLDDHRKVIQSRRSEINKELEKIPVRISEAEIAAPELSAIPKPDTLPGDISKAKSLLKEANERFARLESGGEVAEKTKRLREIEAEIIALRTKALCRHDEAICEATNLQIAIGNKVAGIRGEIGGLKVDRKIKERALAEAKNRVEACRADWHAENARTFEQDDTCPTCGQALPVEMREQAQAEFNCQKANKLEGINAEGKKIKAKADELEAEIGEIEKAISDQEAKLHSESVVLDGIIAKIEAMRRDAENVNDPKIDAKEQERATIQGEIDALRDSDSEAKGKIIEEIQGHEQTLSALEEALAKVGQRKKIDARIEELKAQEKDLAAEFERLEGELYLTEEFVRQKVSLLESKINGKFEMARFKLFDVQVNGGISECCETTYQGVPFGSLNNGARINVGLDIIRTLAKHYSFYPPIFIDNREAVTSLIDMGDQQMINLIVSEQDKELRVEIEGKKEKGVA